MTNPVKSATDIDWDKIAKRLGRAFNGAIKYAEDNDHYNDEDFRENLKAAAAAAEALVKVAAQAQHEAEKDSYKIPKPKMSGASS